MQNITDGFNEYEFLADTIIEEVGFIIDYDTEEMLYMNQSALTQYNITEQDYKGRKCYQVVCALDVPCSTCNKEKLSTEKFSKRYHYSELNGRHLALKEKIEIIGGKRCIVTTGIDISNEDNKKKELLSTSNVDSSIIKCANTLLNETGKSLYELMEILATYYKGLRAYIFELDYKTMTVSCIVDYRTGRAVGMKKSVNDIPFSFDSQWGKLLTSNSHVYVNSIDEVFDKGTPDYEILKVEGTTNFLTIPLNKDGKFIGFIGVEELEEYNNDPRLLLAVSAFVVNNMYKNKALKKLREYKQELDINFEVSQTLEECAKFLVEDNEIESSINLLLETVCNYYGGECAYIFEWDDVTQTLSNDFHYVNENANFVKMKDIDGDILTLWCNIVKNNNMFFMKDRDSDLDYDTIEYRFLKELEVESMLLVPLVRDGVKTGILGCDNLTRNFQTPEMLYTLSGFLMNDIEKKELINELEVLSYTDKLTGLYNRNYYLHLIENHKNLPSKEFGIIFADVNGLKKSNDNLGHEYGDILLKWCAKFLMKSLNSSICRIGGDEFVCFCENIPEEDFDLCVSTMRSTLKKMPHQCMSIGSTWAEFVMDINKQIIETDRMMYLEKQHYYALLKERNLDPKSEIENLKQAITGLEKDIENI